MVGDRHVGAMAHPGHDPALASEMNAMADAGVDADDERVLQALLIRTQLPFDGLETA
ncbi:hypothetical protein GCM10023176_57000 [Micromonospora coerulea]|uniref:Uncharacterized protein n=1 Tax=Micromonospora coerulea TaxID=47856 RepID=A0ABP8T5H8_9ACTN